MTAGRFIDLNPDGLRRLIASRREKTYLLIDVRQPHEYAEGHLPGAQPMPLLELESKLFDLPGDRELIVYCHTGSRSLMAADLIEAAEVTEKPVYHLTGGMVAWDGVAIADVPKVQFFERAGTAVDLMARAMDLEKGAYRFYSALAERFPDESFSPVIRRLERAEEAHARMVYGFWRRLAPDPPNFESCFENLSGDILEGGMSLSDAIARIGQAAVRRCLTVIEFALEIEYAAYDLYRHMAETVSQDDAREVFFAIAQSEKAHMRQLAGALDGCVDNG